jgi:hypothetical protein
LKKINDFEIKEKMFGDDVYTDAILDVILTSIGPGPQIL